MNNYETVKTVLGKCTNINFECVETVERIVQLRQEARLNPADLSAVVVFASEYPHPDLFRVFLSSYFNSLGETTATEGEDEGRSKNKDPVEVWLVSEVSETVHYFLNSCVFKYSDPMHILGGFSPCQLATKERASGPDRCHCEASATKPSPDQTKLASTKILEEATHLRPNHQKEDDASQQLPSRQHPDEEQDAKLHECKKKVLVVEDNFMNQKLICNILRREGYEVRLPS